MSGDVAGGFGAYPTPKAGELNFVPVDVSELHPLPVRALAHGASDIYNGGFALQKSNEFYIPGGRIRYSFGYNQNDGYREHTIIEHDIEGKTSRLVRDVAPFEPAPGITMTAAQITALYEGPLTRGMAKAAPVALSGSRDVPPEFKDVMQMIPQPPAEDDQPLPPIITVIDQESNTTLAYKPLRQEGASREFEEIILEGTVGIEAGQDPAKLPELMGIARGVTNVDPHPDFLPPRPPKVD